MVLLLTFLTLCCPTRGLRCTYDWVALTHNGHNLEMRSFIHLYFASFKMSSKPSKSYLRVAWKGIIVQYIATVEFPHLSPEFKDGNKCEHLTCFFSWTFSCFLHGSTGQKISTCANSNQKVCNCYFTFIKNKVYQKNMSSLGYAPITLTNWKRKKLLNFTHFSIVCCLPHS